MDRTRIKVVKKGSVEPIAKKKRVVPTSRAEARQMVAKVSDWVSDLQERKAQETRAAIDLLFRGNTQPGES